MNEYYFTFSYNGRDTTTTVKASTMQEAEDRIEEILTSQLGEGKYELILVTKRY